MISIEQAEQVLLARQELAEIDCALNWFQGHSKVQPVKIEFPAMIRHDVERVIKDIPERMQNLLVIELNRLRVLAVRKLEEAQNA